MRNLRVAGGSLNQIPLDFLGNTRRIINAIEEAKARQVQLLCLPELAISGYGCEDMFYSEDTIQRSLDGLKTISEICDGITVSVGLPLEYEHCIYNVVALIHDKRVLGFVAKQELPGDGIYYEPRWFKPWEEQVAVTYSWAGEDYMLGDLLFEIDGIRMGFEICEDAWNGIRPAQRHYLNNVDIILNPSASNFAFGKTQVREMLVREASRGYNCTYIYSNHLGNEAGRIIYDGEILIAQSGKLLARNRRFTFDEFVILDHVIDVDQVHIQRKKSFNYKPEFPEHLIEVAYSYTESGNSDSEPKIAPYESLPEELYLAETLALFDYMRKSRSKGFVLSLSGGADSSACAVLCAGAISRAERELGKEKLLDRLHYIHLDENKSLVSQLLSCVYQATENSGAETLESARELANGLGATFYLWNVSGIHESYIKLVENSIQRPLDWGRDDISLQNIQSRLRSPGVWMLANIYGALLITTSNRSEAAVGYATMDGDTSGGLAPLGGIAKTTLLKWLNWAERELHIPSLSYVNHLTPTAELRPSDYDQKDEEDLMPYDILNLIEESAIRDYKSPKEVFLTIRGICPDEQLKAYIVRFFNLWARNQWKRERYAPSFHMDDKNLDPKTWCRFPILNGGFKEALKEMLEIEEIKQLSDQKV